MTTLNHRILILATVHVAVVSTCFGQTTDPPQRTVKVAVCQFLVLPGALERNLAKMEELIARAAAKGAEICAFCELPDLGFEERVTKGNLGAGKTAPYLAVLESLRLNRRVLSRDYPIAFAEGDTVTRTLVEWYVVRAKTTTIRSGPT